MLVLKSYNLTSAHSKEWPTHLHTARSVILLEILLNYIIRFKLKILNTLPFNCKYYTLPQHNQACCNNLNESRRKNSIIYFVLITLYINSTCILINYINLLETCVIKNPIK